jgi:hypothetical protein
MPRWGYAHRTRRTELAHPLGVSEVGGAGYEPRRQQRSGGEHVVGLSAKPVVQQAQRVTRGPLPDTEECGDTDD